MLLAMNFDGKVFYRENESDLDHQLQNKSENRGERTFVLRLTSRQVFSVGCVGHMFFKCDKMRLSSAFYHQNLACFTDIYLRIHVTARLASNGVFR